MQNMNNLHKTCKRVFVWEVLSEGVQLWLRFSFISFFSCSWSRERGSKYHCKWVIIGPPAKRHLNVISLTGRLWPNNKCLLGSFLTFQGIRTRIDNKSYSLVIVQGEGVRTPTPSKSAPVDVALWLKCHTWISKTSLSPAHLRRILCQIWITSVKTNIVSNMNILRQNKYCVKYE